MDRIVKTVIVKMNNISRKVGLGLITLLLFTLFSSQTESTDVEVNNYAFKGGERITYDLYFNWKFIWKKAGTASLSTRTMNYQGRSAYLVNLLASSNGVADKFFRMRDTLTSIVSTGLQPMYYRKAADEGHKFAIDEVRYSQSNNRVNVHMKRVKNGRVTYKTGSDSKQIYDMLSIISRVRSIDPSGLKEGSRLMFPIASGKYLTNETLVFGGRKHFKAENGITYRCMIFTLVENRKGKNEDIITFYVTDDLNHLPIRLDLNLNFGVAKAYMRSATNVRHPFTSIVQ